MHSYKTIKNRTTTNIPVLSLKDLIEIQIKKIID